MFKICYHILVLSLFASTQLAFGQDVTPEEENWDQFKIKQGFQDNKYTDHEVLSLFEMPENLPYTLGAGDILTIDVWDRPQLSAQHVIGPDGHISLPIIGSLKIADLTRNEAITQINYSLSEIFYNPIVSMRIDKYISNRVFILGRVTDPGPLTFEAPPTLLEAIARAGSLPIGGTGAEKATLTRCAVFRGKERMVWIDLKGLLNGNLNLNLRLQRNDIVYIPDSNDQLVYVLGEVKNPGAYNLTPEMSFLDAVSLAGGPTRDAAKSRIKVIRTGQNIRKNINLYKILKAENSENVLLEEHDIVYVPRSGLASFSYVMRQINPFTSLLLLGSALTGSP